MGNLNCHKFFTTQMNNTNIVDDLSLIDFEKGVPYKGDVYYLSVFDMCI